MFFFFNDTATTEIYTLSLHDALPISPPAELLADDHALERAELEAAVGLRRSEEHTSELQSPVQLVCRLLLEKKKQTPKERIPNASRSSDRHHQYMYLTVIAGAQDIGG